MDFVSYGEILVKIQEPDHCTKRLLELRSFLFQSGYALLRQVSSGPFQNDAVLGFFHVVDTFLHLLLDHNKSFLK
jgi:hypothetical protein